MTILLKKNATEENISSIMTALQDMGLDGALAPGETKTLICIKGEETTKLDMIKALINYEGVEQVNPVNSPYKMVSRELNPDYSNGHKKVIDVSGVMIGGDRPVIISGPCTVFNYEQMYATAKAVKEAGAEILRGGAYKPRTSPYSFQGLGEEGLKMLRDVGQEVGMPIITEVMDTRNVEKISGYADILQIGARNMQNFDLLKEAGRQPKPVLLKRGGLEPTLENWLCCAEYIALEGNPNIILCERGIPTRISGEYSRNTLDFNIIKAAQEKTYLPIIVDPSHASGRSDMIEGLSKAALSMGIDGLMIEVMRNNEEPHIQYSNNGKSEITGFCDYKQSLRASRFAKIMQCLKML